MNTNHLPTNPLLVSFEEEAVPLKYLFSREQRNPNPRLVITQKVAFSPRKNLRIYELWLGRLTLLSEQLGSVSFAYFLFIRGTFGALRMRHENKLCCLEVPNAKPIREKKQILRCRRPSYSVLYHPALRPTKVLVC